MAKTKLDFLNTREKRNLRRAANAMESVMKSLRDRNGQPKEELNLGVVAEAAVNPPSADLVLWSYMQRATKALMTSGLVLGTIEGHDKRLEDDARAALKKKQIVVVPR